MNDTLEILVTADGSHTIRSERFGSTYHSIHGAISESLHIFIRAGLHQFYTRQEKDHLSVLELGYGTGLNAFLSLAWCRKHAVRLSYQALELHRVPSEILVKLNYPELVEDQVTRSDFERLHPDHTGIWEQIDPLFRLKLHKDDFLSFRYPEKTFHLVFLDPFDFSVEADHWGPELLVYLHQALQAGGMLVTYGAKGVFKRTLRESGFLVESLPGPKGKREITRAMKK